MEAGVDYKFRDDLVKSYDEKGTTVPVELMVDPFAGIVYRYTRVEFNIKVDPPKVLYDYEIIKTNDLSMMTLRKNVKFNTVVGLVLNMMMLELIDAEGASETGTNYTEEPNQE
jgi:hypothetical protein